MTLFVQHATRAVALLSLCLVLAACSNTEKSSSKYSAHECKQMHGRGNVSLEELRECRFTGQVQRLDSK